MTQRFRIPVQRKVRGDPLKAREWNAIIDNLDRMDPPQQQNRPQGRNAGDPETSAEENEDIESGSTATVTTFTEQSRSTSTFEADGVTYQQIDQIVLTDANGNTMTLIFNNPN